MKWTPEDEAVRNETRRQFFTRGARGLGVAALASMFADAATTDSAPRLPHFPPKVKRAIYLHMVGRHRRWICSITSRR